MAELMDIADAFSGPLKIAWMVWIAWGVGQWFWYRHERRAAQAAPSPAPAEKRRSVPPRRMRPPVIRNIVTPDPDAGAPAVSNDSPIFDPSSAVVETFASVGQELDRLTTRDHTAT